MPEEKGGWSVTQNREPLRQRIHLTRAAAPMPVVSKAKEPGHQIAHLPRMSWNMKYFPVFYVVIDKLHKLFHRKRLQKGFSNVRHELPPFLSRLAFTYAWNRTASGWAPPAVPHLCHRQTAAFQSEPKLYFLPWFDFLLRRLCRGLI